MARLALMAILLLASASASPAQTGRPATPSHGETKESLHEVVRQINNPVSTLWQLTVDNQISGQSGGGLDSVEPGYAGTFQAQMPVTLSKLGLGLFEWTKRYSVITRLELPLFETVVVPSAQYGSPVRLCRGGAAAASPTPPT